MTSGQFPDLIGAKATAEPGGTVTRSGFWLEEEAEAKKRKR